VLRREIVQSDDPAEYCPLLHGRPKCCPRVWPPESNVRIKPPVPYEVHQRELFEVVK
jgi:hypothetical protein